MCVASNFGFYKGIEFPREWKTKFLTDQCRADVTTSVSVTSEQSTRCHQRGTSFLTAQSLKYAETVTLSFTVTQCWQKSRGQAPATSKGRLFSKKRNAGGWGMTVFLQGCLTQDQSVLGTVLSNGNSWFCQKRSVSGLYCWFQISFKLKGF